MMRVLILLFIFSVQTVSALEVYSNPHMKSGRAWTFFYPENDKWQVERVTLDKDGWPQMQARKTFDTRNEARLFLPQLTRGLSKMNALPEDGRELRGSKNDTLWEVTNEWSWEWEVKYAEWVTATLDKYWWQQHGIATDCADVAYSARWIFARINGLPMANRLGNGQWFTYRSVKPEWKKLPTAADWDKDKRFLAALNYMLDFVFTHSLWNDSYPIAINADSLRPGAHHLHLSDTTGHTQFIYRVGLQPDEIPILTLNSTIPRAARELMEFLYFESAAARDEVAFLRMRWPVWVNGQPSLIPKTQMPFHSEEQWDPAFVQQPRTQFWEEVFHRLNPNLDFDLVAMKSLRQLKEMFENRIQVVDDGYKVCARTPCKPGTANYENWSTPHRDERIAGNINTHNMITNYVRNPDQLKPLLETPILNQEGFIFTLEQLMMAFQMNMYSSDPNDDPVIRWGIHPRAAADKIVSLFQTGLPQRESKINKANSCRDMSCMFGSPEYVEASSFDLDQQFWQSATTANVYCVNMGAALCNDLNNRLATLTLSASGRSQSIAQWMKDSYWFNSDPRHTAARRYVGYSQEIAHVPLTNSALFSFQAYASRFMIYQTAAGELRVLQVINNNAVPYALPRGEKPVALDTEAGWLWSFTETQIIARQVDTGAAVTMARKQNSFDVSGHAFAGHAMLSDGSGQILVHIENGAIVTKASLGWATNTNRGDGLVTFVDLNGAEGLVDLRAGTVLMIPTGGNLQTVKRSADGFVVKRQLTEQSAVREACYIVKAQAQPIMLNPTGRCLLVQPETRQAAISENGNVIVREFGADWNPVREWSAGQLDYFQENWIRLDNNRGLCVNKNGIHEPVKTNGVRQTYDCNDRFYIEIRDDGTWQAREIATNQIRLRTAWLMDFASSKRDTGFVASAAPNGDRYREMALLDLDHPENPALLTDTQIWRNWYNTDNGSGLMVMKGNGSVWIGL